MRGVTNRVRLSALKIGQSIDFEDVENGNSKRAGIATAAARLGIKVIMHYYRREKVLHVTRIK